MNEPIWSKADMPVVVVAAAAVVRQERTMSKG